MKFISSLKNKIENKIKSYAIEAINDYIEKNEVFRKDILDLIKKSDILVEKNSSDIQGILKDISYLAEALKNMYYIIEELEKQKYFGSDDDTTFH